MVNHSPVPTHVKRATRGYPQFLLAFSLRGYERAQSSDVLSKLVIWNPVTHGRSSEKSKGFPKVEKKRFLLDKTWNRNRHMNECIGGIWEHDCQDGAWMRRDSIYTQTYDEQQIKSANEPEGNPQGTVRECEHYIQPTIVTQKV